MGYQNKFDMADRDIVLHVSLKIQLGHELLIFEPTGADTRWAPRHRFLSVRLSVRPCVTIPEVIRNIKFPK